MSSGVISPVILVMVSRWNSIASRDVADTVDVILLLVAWVGVVDVLFAL